MSPAIQCLIQMIDASSNFTLLKITEDPKGLLLVWVLLIILRIKREILKIFILCHAKIIINPLHVNINYRIYFLKAVFSIQKKILRRMTLF